jgi:hypothetical protein
MPASCCMCGVLKLAMPRPRSAPGCVCTGQCSADERYWRVQATLALASPSTSTSVSSTTPRQASSAWTSTCRRAPACVLSMCVATVSYVFCALTRNLRVKLAIFAVGQVV